MSSLIKSKIVIVPVHNQLELLRKCLQSVILSTDDPCIIIIDDGSTDIETKKFIEAQPLVGNIKTFRNETAQGFSAACNKGIQYALDNYDFNCLCLLNSDAEIVTDNWFAKVEQHFITGDRIGVAGVMSNNAMAQTVHNIPEYLKRIESKPTVYCTFVHGFCLFLSKDIIETVGLLDEKVFRDYGSEDDLALKSVQQGFKNIIVGSVFVKHVNEASYSKEVRAKHIKKSLPALQKKWGYKYVSDCVHQANRIGKHLNDK